MRQYETGFLISPDLPEEETESLIEQLAKVVTKNKGKMAKEDKWGIRKLAYPIKKFEEGFYVFFHYEGESAIPTELERRFKQTDAILRFLTVKVDQREIKVKKKKREVAKDEAEPVPEEEKVEELEFKEEKKEEAPPEKVKTEVKEEEE